MIIYQNYYHEKEFTTQKFVCSRKKAEEVKEGDRILLSNGNTFCVDYIDTFFINEEIADLYADTVDAEEIKPEHSKYEFTDEDNGGKNGKCFTDIPYNAEFTVLSFVSY
jgi:hypothetical protein